MGIYYLGKFMLYLIFYLPNKQLNGRCKLPGFTTILVVLWFFRKSAIEPLRLKKPGLTSILSIVAWVLRMGLNNYSDLVLK